MLYINHGDITKVTSGVIAHGVNLQNVMGSGVAKALYTKWPAVKFWYHRLFTLEDLPRVGQSHYVYISDKIAVVNCITQEYYGNDGKVYADIDAIDKCLSTVLTMMTVTELFNHLHIPRIGCDLGGLDWEEDVKPVVLRLANKYPHIRIDVWEIDERKL